jgi:hypothetical protein
MERLWCDRSICCLQPNMPGGYRGDEEAQLVSARGGTSAGPLFLLYCHFWLKPFWPRGNMNRATTLPYKRRRRTWLSVGQLKVALNYPRYGAESCTPPA